MLTAMETYWVGQKMDCVAGHVSRFDIFVQLEFWRQDQYMTCSINYVQLYSQYLQEARTEQIASPIQNTCLHGTLSVCPSLAAIIDELSDIQASSLNLSTRLGW